MLLKGALPDANGAMIPALEAAGVVYLSDLQAFTAQGLLHIPGIGKKMVSNLVSFRDQFEPLT